MVQEGQQHMIRISQKWTQDKASHRTTRSAGAPPKPPPPKKGGAPPNPHHQRKAKWRRWWGGGGKGGGKRAAGANSRSRFGIYSTNVMIYSGILMTSLGLALIMSSSNKYSPWLHECWEQIEMLKTPGRISAAQQDFGCKRIYTEFDTIIGFYALLFGVIVGVVENFTGWERSGKPQDFYRSIGYMVLVLPCFAAMTTVIPAIFIISHVN